MIEVPVFVLATLMSLIFALLGWIAKNVYDIAQANNTRLTIVETTLDENIKPRLKLLEHKVNEAKSV